MTENIKLPVYVFVYGTLKRGSWNNGLLVEGGAKYIEDYVLPNFKLYRNPPSFPLGNIVEGCQSMGEVWEIYDQKTLQRLDHLEGHPHFYKRTTVKPDYLYDPYGRVADVPLYTYVYNGDCEKQGVEICNQLPLGEYYWDVKKAGNGW